MKVPQPQTRWLIYWAVVFGVLGFVLPEAFAIVNDEPGDTLSESLRYTIDAVPGGLGPLLFVGFIVWFVPHILKRRK